MTLTYIQQGLDQLHVPYSYGWAIISLTLLTKIVTFPFTRIQVRDMQTCASLKQTMSSMSMAGNLLSRLVGEYLREYCLS